MLITHRNTLADPYFYHTLDASLTIMFYNYGNPLEVADAILALEKASLQAWSMKLSKFVGTRPRSYKHGTSEFYIEPQARLTWKTYRSVTVGIMTFLKNKLPRETSVSILGNDDEGFLGRGSVHNIA